MPFLRVGKKAERYCSIIEGRTRSMKNTVTVLFLMMLSSCSYLSPKESHMRASQDPWHLFEPFWSSSTAWSESLLFMQKDDASLPEANLCFTPTEVLAVRNSRGDVTYEEGCDYIVKAGARSLALPKGSRIPSKKQEEIYKDNRADKSQPYRSVTM
jgi:hypothetical protein